MAEHYKRVNILIRPDQHQDVMSRGLTLSGLVRDLLDDRFSDSTIVLSVKKESKQMYDHIISNFGISDEELAEYVVEALDKFLEDKSGEIDRLRAALKSGRMDK